MIRAFKMRLEYGMGPEFEKRHAEVWPEVEKMIHEYGGSNCSVFLDERQGVLFGVITVENEERWASIRDDVLLKKWFDYISPTVKVTRENRPEAIPPPAGLSHGLIRNMVSKTNKKEGRQMKGIQTKSLCKSWMVLFGAIAMFSVAVARVGADEVQNSPKQLKVLMIGNSFSVQMVSSMPPVAKDLGLGLDICSLYIGGCSLDCHWKNVCAPTSTPYNVTRSVDGESRKAFKGNIPTVLGSEKWDVVTIQQASHFSWKPGTYRPWGDNLVKYIREKAPQAKIVVHETWSYTPWDGRLKGWKIDQDEMYEKLHAAYGDFAKQYGFDVIPTGTAVQLVRKELPVKYTESSLGGDVVGSCTFVEKDGKWTSKGDVFHMGPDGNYLQALVWTAKLFGADVSKCSYKPGKMTDERAAFLRQMAMKAVEGKE